MTNQLTNPSVEVDLTGYQTSSATLTRRTPSGGGAAPDGSWVMEAAYTSGTNMLVNTDNMTVAANPGETWSAGLYGRSTGGTARVMRADIQFLDASNVVLATTNGASVTATGTFQQAKNEGVVAPASTARVRIRMTYVGAVVGDVAEFDAWQLEQGATLPAYNPVTGGATVTDQIWTENGFSLALEDGTPLLKES